MNSGKNPSLVEARKMMTREEIARGISPFDCAGWEKKKIEIRKQVILAEREAKGLEVKKIINLRR